VSVISYCGQTMTDAPSPLIHEAEKPLILVGNGDYDTDMLAKFAPMGPVVAVDGGYYGCRMAGIIPQLVIGDMDSVDPADLADSKQNTVIHPISEQDTTDLEKALRHLSAPVIIGIGFLGKRFDHSLAALTVLAKYAGQHQVVLIGRDDIIYVGKGAIKMTPGRGKRVSIWPLGPITFASSSGLTWPLDGLTMAPDKLAGTSNVMQSRELEIIPQQNNQSAYALLMETDCLEPMLDALLAQALGVGKP